MEVTIKQENQKVIVKIAGRVDTVTAPRLSDKIEAFYNVPNTAMVLDCINMDYISSVGLRIFLNAYKALTVNGGTLVVTGIQPSVRSILDLSGFSKFLNIQ